MSSSLALLSILLLAVGAVVDPTLPATRAGLPAQSEQSPFRLSSIVVSPARRVVVINGTRLGVGDRIGGARILEINLHSVRLSGSEGGFTLRLSGPPVKRFAGESP